MYKLVAIDIDDTLINDDRQVTEGTLQAIKTAHENGVMVALATGRMFAGAYPIAKQVGLDIPVISYQGALIKDLKSNHILYEKSIPANIVQKIIQYSKKKGVHLQISSGDKLYAREDNDKVRTYAANQNIPYYIEPDFDTRFLEEPVTKMLINENPEVVDQLLHELKPTIGQECFVTKSKPFFLEFTHQEVNKGEAIKFLCNHIGCQLEEVIAIGDSWNDIQMLEVAGLPVSMGNATDDLKQVAKYITSSNNEEGVKEVFEKFVLNQF
ncbi:Cof-type HAD-IIB family hydrolase [Aquibacillus sediminis]|uniref:Cof-type HAD-IIB family hydrolase n=1 Tax=Aquibacillus sediminis TaxID=2574734 RepID=UPI001107C70B|nr:Cof-type HAD-IIB family hydrolase [Aquibacillus sediminis]